jgi:hypothetical protein
MQSSGVAIGSFATAYFGIQTHDRAKFVARTRVSASFRPAIDGGNISRYSLSPAIEFVNFEPQAIKSGGNPTVYAKERIGVRQIGRVPVATLLPAGLLTLNTIYNIHIIRESPYDLRMVLGVLSSRAGRYFWLTRFFDHKKTFPKVKKPDLLNVPMPLADKNTEGLSKLSSSVDLLLSMHKRLIAEALPRRREQIQREIDATDRQIDQLMYQLYGLTDEEIKIVEEATH